MNKYNLYILTVIAIFLTVLMMCFGCVHNEIIDDQIASNSNKEIEREKLSSIPQEIEEKLKSQAEIMFEIFKTYDLEAADYYVPTIEEWSSFLKVFDKESFSQKWSIFEKQYNTNETQFGDDPIFDQELFKNISSRMGILRVRSSFLTYERLNMSNDNLNLEEVIIQPSLFGNGFYDMIIHFKDNKTENIYGFKNEACWMTNRGCLNNLGWSYLGLYREALDSYMDSGLNMTNITRDDLALEQQEAMKRKEEASKARFQKNKNY